MACTIEISGISVKLPECDNIQEFGEKLFAGVDLVTEDHESRRWSKGLYGLPPRSGKLTRLDQFDAAAFGLNEKQANVMDPMLRLLLECTFEAVYDAGVNPTTLRGSNTGVFVGAAKSESSEILLSDPDSVADFNLVGHSRGMFANAISYFFGLHGPSLTTETACSSSLQALERAVAAIRSGQCDSAIVGGANLLLKPEASLEFHRLSMLSPDGKCKTFDASANGYVRSEAVVVIYIQKSDLARKSYATILNIKSNSDGYKEQGITYPSGCMQAQLLHEVYSEIGLDPAEVVYVEAHGTGTAIGDPQEVNAIADHFCPHWVNREPLLIGSVKSNMGHAEHGSGLCALAKVIVAIVCGKIPGNLHFREANPKIPGLIDGRLKVVDSEYDLSPLGLIGVNSFGFGGSNVHLILRPSQDQHQVPDQRGPLPLLIPFSGRTHSSTSETLEKLKQRLELGVDTLDSECVSKVALASLLHEIYRSDIAIHAHRGFLIVEAGAEMTSFIQENPLLAEPQNQPQTWLIFSGMGSQWPGMGTALLQFEPFKTSILECCTILKPYGLDLWHLLTSGDESALESTTNSFVAVATVQIGLVDLLTAVGLTAVDGIIGHSIGENVCAYVDGYATKKQTLLVPYYAGLIFQQEQEAGSMSPGTMATIGLSWEETKARCPPSIHIACHNAPDNVSVAGPVADVEAFVEELKNEGVFAREIKAGQAFHSPYIAALEQKLDQMLVNNRVLGDGLNSRRERSNKWVSTSCPEEQWNSDEAKYISSCYFAHNLVSPVLFQEALEKIPANSIVIEVGPHCLLQPILKRSLAKTNATVFGISNKNATNKVGHVLSTLGKIWAAGRQHNFDWPKLYRGTEALTPVFLSQLVAWDHEQSFRVVNFEQDRKATHLNTVKISIDEHPYLKSYQIDGNIIFPSMGYLVLVWKHIAQIRETDFQRLPIKFEDVFFHRMVSISQDEKGATEFSINVLEGNGHFEVMHEKRVVCNGVVRIVDADSHAYTSQQLDESVQHGHPNEMIVHWSGNWVEYLESVAQAQIGVISQFGQKRTLSSLEYAHIDPRQAQLALALLNSDVLKSKIMKISGSEFHEAVVAQAVELRGVQFQTKLVSAEERSDDTFSSTLNNPRTPESCRIQFALTRVHAPSTNKNLLKSQTPPTPAPLLYSFAGVNPAGEQMMGLSREFSPAGNTNDCDHSGLLWKVPTGPDWNLQDAAAVPFAYAVAFYALCIKAELKPTANESVLIPLGMSDIGQASIRVALSYGATVFTTVTSCREKDTLLELCPALNQEHHTIIVHGKESGFGHEILEATNGNGVNVVMCASETSLQESVECVAQHGRLLYVQDQDQGCMTNASNGKSALGMAFLLKNVTFFGINLAANSETNLFDSSSTADIFELLSNGIQSGVVRPVQHLKILGAHSSANEVNENLSCMDRVLIRYPVHSFCSKELH